MFNYFLVLVENIVGLSGINGHVIQLDRMYPELTTHYGFPYAGRLANITSTHRIGRPTVIPSDNSTMGELGERTPSSPIIRGQIFIPSITRCSDRFAPPKKARVGNISIVFVSSSHTMPAGILPDQQYTRHAHTTFSHDAPQTSQGQIRSLGWTAPRRTVVGHSNHQHTFVQSQPTETLSISPTDQSNSSTESPQLRLSELPLKVELTKGAAVLSDMH